MQKTIQNPNVKSPVFFHRSRHRQSPNLVEWQNKLQLVYFKKQCSGEPSTNHSLPQIATKTVDVHPVLPSQTSANETKKRRSIELVSLLLLDNHTDIVNPTQPSPFPPSLTLIGIT